MQKKIFGFCLMALGLAACTTPIQRFYDAEADRLCAVDGGIHVYENVQLPLEDFDKYGIPKFVAYNKHDALRAPYRVINEMHYVKGTPSKSSLFEADLVRHSVKIVRVSDEKILGESVSYIRRGGDLPLIDHPSGYLCPESKISLEKSIFSSK